MRQRVKSPALTLTIASLLVASSACTSPEPTPPASAPASTATVLRNFTLIDGNGGAPVADAALVMDEGRITWVGPASQLQAPAGAPVQDLSGKFIMPGIINLHAHVAASDGITQDPKTFFTRENVTAQLKLYASYGVTTVASMGTDQPLVYEIRDQQRAGRPTEARIFTAGRGFTAKGGYPTQTPGGIPGVPYEEADPAQASADVKALAANRPDVVKIWVDDHFRVLPKIPIGISKAIIDAAHASSLKAVAHIFYLNDAKALADAGLDGFTHSVRDTLADEALLSTMKARGTWMMSATLAREAAMFAVAEPDAMLSDPFLAKVVPANVQALWKSPEFQKRLRADPQFKNYPRYLKNAQQNLKRLADAGVKYAFGTDTGPPSRFGGYGEHWEMALMVEAGLTPAQVITAATKSGAEFLGARDLGTIERGKWADLIVLAANPLEDIKNTRGIDAVYVAGTKIPR
jgi:imidazolonepropionase-like amidohydrolase